MTGHMLYSKNEEIMNSISHGVGSLLAVVGGSVMITLSACYHGCLAVVASAVYSFTLIVMFTFSTLYHAIPYQRVKRVLQVFDHVSIYLLIAGTYTPITLITLRGTASGIFIFATVWLLAIVGIVLNAVNLNRFKRVSLLLYIGMGWAVLWDLRGVIAGLGQGGFALLLAGGISYTVGIIFYKLKKIPYMHGVWHIFVLIGGVLHYLCVLLYVLPVAA